MKVTMQCKISEMKEINFTLVEAEYISFKILARFFKNLQANTTILQNLARSFEKY